MANDTALKNFMYLRLIQKRISGEPVSELYYLRKHLILIIKLCGPLDFKRVQGDKTFSDYDTVLDNYIIKETKCRNS